MKSCRYPYPGISHLQLFLKACKVSLSLASENFKEPMRMYDKCLKHLCQLYVFIYPWSSSTFFIFFVFLVNCSFAYRAREWDPITSGHWWNTWRHILVPGGNLCAGLSTCDRITDVKTRWARDGADFLTLVRDNWMLFSAAVCWFDVSLLGWT